MNVLRLSKLPPTLLAVVLILTPAVAAGPQGSAADSLLALRELDGMVATIGHRLAVANVERCSERQWRPGLALHDLSQYSEGYRADAKRVFGLGEGPSILALAKGGPAERAGVRLDDAVAEMDGVVPALPSPAAAKSFDSAAATLIQLEQAFADGGAELLLRRKGQPVRVRVAGELGCSARFQLVPSRRLNAAADGQYVQITSAIGNFVADEAELAAVLAHELAHNILAHRRRLKEAKVSRGFMENFGRNARLIRATENEADRLSVHLLDRAGYDPEAAVRFWRRMGRKRPDIIFAAPTHPSSAKRVTLLQAEIAAMRASKARAAGAGGT